MTHHFECIPPLDESRVYHQLCTFADSKVHGTNMGPTRFLSVPDGPMLAPWTLLYQGYFCTSHFTVFQMGSRVMWQVASVLFILGGVFGKFGAALAILPDPVVSGMMLVGLSMVFAVAIGNLETVNMRISRNQMVLGLAIVLGVTIPLYVKQELKHFDTGEFYVHSFLQNAPKSCHSIFISLRSNQQ